MQQTVEAPGYHAHSSSSHRASATDPWRLPDACRDAVLLLGPLSHLLMVGERRFITAEAARLLQASDEFLIAPATVAHDLDVIDL